MYFLQKGYCIGIGRVVGLLDQGFKFLLKNWQGLCGVGELAAFCQFEPELFRAASRLGFLPC